MPNLFAHPDNGLPTLMDMHGHPRILARLLPEARRSKAIRFKDAFAPIPRSKWQPIDRRAVLGTQFILNQESFGACVGFSAAEAEMRSRFLRGMGFVILSGAYVYSWINGGSDNGAVITDAAAELQQHGVCTEASCPLPNIYRSQVSAAADAEAGRFKLNQVVLCTSFDEIGTALQMDLIPQFPLQVGSNFEDFDGDGCAGYADGSGNHSVHADGMKQRKNGDWLLDMPNTWGAVWGPSQNGRCFLSEQSIAGCSADSDAYVHIDPNWDPQAVQQLLRPR